MKKQLDNIYRGESYTIALAFENLENIQNVKLYLDSTELTIEAESNLYVAKLNSTDTINSVGKKDLILVIDSEHLGIKKQVLGEFNFLSIEDRYSDNRTSELNSITINVTVTEMAIEASHSLYNILKGRDGKDFTYEDFTAEQIEEFKRPATEAATAVQAELSNLATLKTETAQAVENANAATSNANEAASNANSKAELAQTAATNATAKITEVDEELQAIDTATSLATTAAENAKNATANVEAAIKNATSQADYAKEQGDYAKSQGDVAKAKADEATNTLTQANQVKSDLEEYKSNLEDLQGTFVLKNEIINGNFQTGFDNVFDVHPDVQITHMGNAIKVEATSDIVGYNTLFKIEHNTASSTDVYYFSLFAIENTADFEIYGISGVSIGSTSRLRVRGTGRLSRVAIGTTYSTIYTDFRQYAGNTVLDGQSFVLTNFIKINITKTFGAGNEPTAQEMDALLEVLGVNYFEGELTVTDKQIALWQLNLIRKNSLAITALGGTII